MTDFSNKRVLVTGAGTGIGQGIAREFSARGANVVFHYSQDGEEAKQDVERIVSNGKKAWALKADFSDILEAQALANQAISLMGGIDVLVNNAGITLNGPIESITPSQFDFVYAVNVRAPLFLAQAAIPSMLAQQRGAIINISSIHALAGRQHHAIYAGTRGAIVSFTRSLAIELAPRGIRVNGIAPGTIEVQNYHKLTTFNRDEAAKGIPAQITGQPVDIARVACFLASEESKYIIGQTLVVDGGTTSWMSFSEDFKAPHTVQFGKGFVPGM